jgi:DNA mismatch repair protein MutS2
MVTTHYSNLKIFASTAEGLENASMLFNNVR